MDKEKKSKVLTKPVLISGIVLTFIFIGSFLVFSYVFNTTKGKSNEGNQQTVTKKKLVNMSLGEEFVVNLADQGGKRYIKTNITIAYDRNNKNFAKAAEENIVVLRDAVINYLKLKKVEETKDTEQMKKGLIENLNKAVEGNDIIQEVYFQSLIVQ